MARKRSGGTGTAASRSARRDAKVRQAGGKVISVRLSPEAARALDVGRGIDANASQDVVICAALIAFYTPWKSTKLVDVRGF